MRLIAGILQLDGSSATEDMLALMAAAMTPSGLRPSRAHRIDGPAGLLILDFSDDQAALSERDGWIVAADLRLDRPTGTIEDEVLRAIEDHGTDFPDRLDGDFGVALWDRTRQALWLGRDFIGARPLAWTWSAGRHFAFASLPKGLHASGLASPAPDLVGLATKASQTYFSGSDSGFADIRYLEAGHSLRISPADEGPPQPHRAYRPDPSQVGRWRGTPKQAAATLRTLIEEAVAARMPNSGPVACHLTGGLDSSAISVLAARAGRQRPGCGVFALSRATAEAIGPAGLDERPLIADVLRQEPGIDHLYVGDDVAMPGDKSDPDWPCSAIGGGDDRIMEAAAAFGADRLLSGVGGDEGATYNGARPYLALLRSGRWPSLLRELRARAKRADISLLRVAYRQLVSPVLPRGLRRKRAGMFDDKAGVMRYLAPTMAERVRTRRLRPTLHSNRAEDRVRAFADHHIPSRCTYYSIFAARHGIAVSFPMLDRRVVDFILSLPMHRLLADGYARQPFREAMRGILPERLRTTEAKVGLFDQRFMLYAERRSTLLAEVDRLQALALPILSEMFDLEALRAGLERIPTSDEIADRASRGTRIVGTSPWSTGFTIEALTLARELADRALVEDDRDKGASGVTSTP
ncbi:MAG: asparagine synthase-related protein [Pseudomonadota bacterium]